VVQNSSGPSPAHLTPGSQHPDRSDNYDPCCSTVATLTRIPTITMEPVQTITPIARRRAGPGHWLRLRGRCITSTGVDQTATGVEAATKKEAPALAILSPMRHSSHTSGDSRWQDRIECSSRQLTNHEAG
jgi:hypothetical protein